MSAPNSAQQRFFFGIAAAAALLLLTFPVLQAFVVDEPPAEDPPVLIGNTDPEPPVVRGGAGTWEELFSKVGNNPTYWSCFEQRTGHSRNDALVALAREREGWNVEVTIVSNTSVTAGDAALDSKGIPRDPDVVQLNGFSNTRGAGEGNCQAFEDMRAQVRVALTLPGPDANTPGKPVVLGHCGNPIGYPQGPPPPAETVPPTHESAPVPHRPDKPVTPTPPTTPPPVPGKCTNQGEFCGTPDSGPDFDPVNSNPRPGSPGVVPGNTETNNNQQDQDAGATRGGADPYRDTDRGTPGTGTGSGVNTSPGETDNNTDGTSSTGGTAGSWNPDNNTNTAGQTNNGAVSPPP